MFVYVYVFVYTNHKWHGKPKNYDLATVVHSLILFVNIICCTWISLTCIFKVLPEAQKKTPKKSYLGESKWCVRPY